MKISVAICQKAHSHFLSFSLSLSLSVTAGECGIMERLFCECTYQHLIILVAASERARACTTRGGPTDRHAHITQNCSAGGGNGGGGERLNYAGLNLCFLPAAAAK